MFLCIVEPYDLSYVGQYENDRILRDINNPQHMDIDVAYFFMLSQNLSLLLGAIIRPANRKVRLRNFEGFRNWLHVISDLVVIKVYAGETDVERKLTKVKILKPLKLDFASLY